MTYNDVLLAIVILGIIAAPLSASMFTTSLFVNDSNKYVQASEIAKQEVSKTLIQGSLVDGTTNYKDSSNKFDIQKQINTGEKLVKISVTWNGKNGIKKYELYGTIPVKDYNS